MDLKSKKIDLSDRLLVVIGLLVFSIFYYVSFQMVYQFNSLEQLNSNQITVSGQGKVYTSPDIATLTLGVQTEGKDVKEITQKNVSSMNKIIDGLKKLNIENKDIQTAQYTVNSQYDWTEEGGRVLKGYTISQNVEVKIRDFTKIGDVLSMATENGANVVGDLQFSIEDAEQFKTQARAEAIKQAKEKAVVLAQQTGINLGDIINVYEDSYGYAPVAYSSAKLMGAGTDAVQESAQIESGEQTVTVTVNLTYKVK